MTTWNYEHYKRKFGEKAQGWRRMREIADELAEAAPNELYEDSFRIKQGLQRTALPMERSGSWDGHVAERADEWSGVSKTYSPDFQHALTTTFITKRRSVDAVEKQKWLGAALTRLGLFQQ